MQYQIDPHDGPKTPDAEPVADAAPPTSAEIRDGKQSARDALDTLSQKDRVLTESILLPAAAKLSAVEITEVVKKFIEYTRSRGISAAEVGRQIGYSKSVMSAWAIGSYAGDVDGVTRAVNDFIHRDSKRRAHRRPDGYVSTRLAEDLRACAYLADQQGMMACVTLPSGSGKSLVLKALKEELNGVYIYVSAGSSARDILYSIAFELGWETEKGTRSRLERYIVEKLKGQKRCLLIDEAQNAGRNIGALRSIHDLAGIAIVMAGSAEILSLIDDRSHGRGQMSSRIIRFDPMSSIHNAEAPDGGKGGASARTLFTVAEIRAFFDRRKIRVNMDALRMVHGLACLPSYGTIRLVENIISTILALDSTVTLITKEHVATALNLLVGGEAIYLQRLSIRHEEDQAQRMGMAAMAG